MRFWLEILAGFLCYAFIGWIFVLFYLAIQWFMQATDITVDCSWNRDGGKCHPDFEFQNRSMSKTYLLSSITYSRGSDKLVWFDRKSLMGKELKPRSVQEFHEVAPVKNTDSIAECLQFQITLRMQSGRTIRLEDERTGVDAPDGLQRTAYKVRDLIERWMEKTA
jgi:hypothetical protein